MFFWGLILVEDLSNAKSLIENPTGKSDMIIGFCLLREIFLICSSNFSFRISAFCLKSCIYWILEYLMDSFLSALVFDLISTKVSYSSSGVSVNRFAMLSTSS
jgi:hypothetical protein